MTKQRNQETMVSEDQYIMILADQHISEVQYICFIEEKYLFEFNRER